MSRTLSKENIEEFSKSNSFEDLIRLFIHGYDKDLCAEDEIKLKKIVCAVKWSLFLYGIDTVYSQPDLIGLELAHRELMDEWFKADEK